MKEFPFEEVSANEADIERIFRKGNRRGKTWDKEKFLEVIQNASVHHWTLEQFVENFSRDPSIFKDERDIKKSIKRFLRRVLKNKRAEYEVTDDDVIIYVKKEEDV